MSHKPFKTFGLSVLFVLMLSACQTTGDTGHDLEKGEAALALRGYERAAEIFRPLAQTGDPKANHYMGYLYYWGYGVEENEETAFAYYTRAAESGYAPAQNALANQYADGAGVPRDDGMAVKWYRRAAAQGLADAQYSLGLVEEKGYAGAPNPEGAIGWYRKAAAQEHELAMHRLGLLLVAAGSGTPAHQEGMMWLHFAQNELERSRGYALSDEHEGYYDRMLDRVRAEFALEALTLADDYAAGRGVPASETRAQMWLLIAEWHGSREAGKRLRAQGFKPLESSTGSGSPTHGGKSLRHNTSANLPAPYTMAIECFAANFRFCG